MEIFETVKFQSSKQKAILSQLYLDLKLSRKVEEIKLHSWDEFDIKYLTVIYCEHKEVYLPVAVDDQLTVRRLCSFQIHAFRKHKATRLTLAIMDTCTTTVFFCITPGLILTAEPDLQTSYDIQT